MSPLPATLLQHALEAYNARQFKEALRLSRQLRYEQRSNAESLYVEVMALLALEKNSKAAALLKEYERTFASTPHTVALARHAWGRFYAQEGKNAQALPLLQQAGTILRDNSACLLDVAESCRRAGKLQEAKQAFLQALALNPDNAELLTSIAECALQLGAGREAAAYANAAYTLEASASRRTVQAHAYRMQGEATQALALYQDAVQQGGETLERLLGLAWSYTHKGNTRKAESLYEKALLAHPGNITVHLGLAKMFEKAGRLERAVWHARQCLTLEPDNIAHYIDLSNLEQQRLNHHAAHQHLDAAEKIAPNHPDIAYSRGFVKLLQGQWREGFPLYEQRWNTSALGVRYTRVTAPLSSPSWDGEASLDGKVVMALCEQGAGDLLQFARYAEHLTKQGAVVDVLAPPFMVDILQTLPWIRAVHHRYELVPPHDFHVSFMSCPLLFGTTPATIPWPGAYLHAPAPRPRFTHRRTVGIAWKGDPSNPYDHWRSLPFATLRPLLERHPDISFVSLQYGALERDARAAVRDGLLLDGAAGVRTLGGIANILPAVDSVVSVCTANAHLAGAMGKDTTLLLAHYADWRWQPADTTTPWYPSMRLLRQKREGEWETVLEALDAVLRAG
jgi:tetratricopeptide (TPR) repeat protein